MPESRSTPRLIAVLIAVAALMAATATSCAKVTPEGNAAFVAVLARDVRGGQAPPWVRDDALRQLAGGVARSKVVDAAVASQDAHDTLVQDAYGTVLGQPPTFDEETAWLAHFKAAQPESDLHVALLASDDLYTQAGGTNAAFVDRVAVLVVGSPLAGPARDDAIARLDGGGSRASFARSLWESSEAAGRRVDATYQRLLGRAPTADERARWTDTLRLQDTSELTRALAASDEYYTHARRDLARLVVDTAELRVGTVGVPVETELAAFGGTPPYEWTVADAPSWLHLAGSTLSGTPTTAHRGTVTLAVRDAEGRTASRDVPLRVASAPPAFLGFDSGDAATEWHGTLTEDGGDQYGYTFGDGRLTVDAAASNQGSNLRAVIVPTLGPSAQNGQSCATWTSQSWELVQQGAALQVRVSDTGRIRALTVTKNMFLGGVWIFHLHTWDTDRPSSFEQFGEIDLTRAFRRLDAGAPLPWTMCARVLDGHLEFKVWLTGGPEPAWGDPRHGARVAVPDGWDVVGQVGWYIGHIPPAGSAAFDDLTSGTYDEQPPTVLKTAPPTDAGIGPTPSGLRVYSDPGPAAGDERGG